MDTSGRPQGRLSIVVGGQMGSECKGHVTAQLAARAQAGLCVRVYGPNAGHVVVGPDGREWKLRSVPVAAVSNPAFQLGIGMGSEVDFSVLEQEVSELDAAGYQVRERLTLDPRATVLTSEHIRREQELGLNARLGSTAKGIGAARADRIMRVAQTVEQAAPSNFRVGPVDELARAQFESAAGFVLLEHAQGAGLGLHTSRYPFTTSADCRAIDALAATGISPWGPVPKPTVWIVFRTRPIRVAGNSGPLRGETTFEELGWEIERTTVTNRVRRIGEWDPDLAREAVWINGGPAPNVRVALMQWDKECPDGAFAQRWSDLSPKARDSARFWCERVKADTGATVHMLGTSPRTVVVAGANGFLGRSDEANPSWRGEERSERPGGTYQRVHERVTRLRGQAGWHACARCGAPAQDWAYDHEDPDEVEDVNRHGNRIVFSWEPSHYVALCRSCHAKFDGYGGDASRAKTHCPAGHEYSEENTYLRPEGKRQCRTCKKTQLQNWRRSKSGG